MSFNHSVIWIDHQEAHVIYFNPTASESEVQELKLAGGAAFTAHTLEIAGRGATLL